MSQPVRGPFEELDLSDGLWPQPHRLLRLVRAQFLAESGAVRLREIHEWVAAHPAFNARFQDDLSTPGLRIPVTAAAADFHQAVEIGRIVIWLQTFGERMIDPKNNRPAQPPRLPMAQAPRIPAAGEISQDPSAMPDTLA
jgi:hypothetical protein